jgi:hypothetical protein
VRVNSCSVVVAVVLVASMMFSSSADIGGTSTIRAINRDRLRKTKRHPKKNNILFALEQSIFMGVAHQLPAAGRLNINRSPITEILEGMFLSLEDSKFTVLFGEP